MRLRRLGLAASAALLVLAGLGTVAAVALTGHSHHRQDASAARSVQLSCPASALGGTLPARVYLPAGYTSSGPRLPVIYFLHGLPAGPETYEEYSFVAQAVAHDGLRAIVVAPQGARHPDSDQEYLDWSAHDDWPRAITQQLVSCIDARFRTIPDRRGRALVGLSAGGYGAFDIGLRALATFAAVESWSGYFVATDPSGEQVLKLPTAAAQAAATVPRGAALSAELARYPSLIGFYVGQSDARFADDNASFDESLGTSRIPHVYRTYPGGHTQSLWEAEAPAWLRMALTYLSSGHVVAP